MLYVENSFFVDKRGFAVDDIDEVLWLYLSLNVIETNRITFQFIIVVFTVYRFSCIGLINFTQLENVQYLVNTRTRYMCLCNALLQYIRHQPRALRRRGGLWLCCNMSYIN